MHNRKTLCLCLRIMLITIYMYAMCSIRGLIMQFIQAPLALHALAIRFRL